MKWLPPPERAKTWAIVLMAVWLALLIWALYTEGAFG